MVQNHVIRDRLISSVTSSIVLTPLIMMCSVIGSVVVARVLGPELFAVKAAFLAVTTGLVVFCDFGLSRSLGKILPDLSVRFGNAVANDAARRIQRLHLFVTLVGLSTIAVLDYAGILNIGGEISLRGWFFVLMLFKILVGIPVTQRQCAANAAFRRPQLYKIQLLLSFAEPPLIISAALLFRDPYAVIAVTVLSQLVHLGLLHRFVKYDLDTSRIEDKTQELSLPKLGREYGSYIGMTYLVFLFNRFVIRLPLAYAVLAYLREPAAVVANVAIAVSLVTHGWAVVHIPLAGLRGPLVARLLAAEDETRFRDSHRVLLGLLIVTSATGVILAYTLGTPVLLLLYGNEYSTGVTWGITAAIVGLLGNFFCMGNTILHQRRLFRVELSGLAIAATTLVMGLIVSVRLMPPEHRTIGILLSLVGARIAFWLATDLWTDWVILRWDGSGIKLGSLVAVGFALLSTHLLPSFDDGFIQGILGCLLALFVFWALFRFFGGIGERPRELLTAALAPRLHWIINRI